jgi:hypothetical protein
MIAHVLFTAALIVAAALTAVAAPVPTSVATLTFPTTVQKPLMAGRGSIGFIRSFNQWNEPNNYGLTMWNTSAGLYESALGQPAGALPCSLYGMAQLTETIGVCANGDGPTFAFVNFTTGNVLANLTVPGVPSVPNPSSGGGMYAAGFATGNGTGYVSFQCDNVTCPLIAVNLTDFSIRWVAQVVSGSNWLYLSESFIFGVLNGYTTSALTVVNRTDGSIVQWMQLPIDLGQWSPVAVSTCGDAIMISTGQSLYAFTGWPSPTTFHPYPEFTDRWIWTGWSVCMPRGGALANNAFAALMKVGALQMAPDGYQIMFFDAVTQTLICNATMKAYSPSQYSSLNVNAFSPANDLFGGIFALLTNGDLVFISQASVASRNCTMERWMSWPEAANQGNGNVALSVSTVAGRPTVIVQLQNGYIAFVTGRNEVQLLYGPTVLDQDGGTPAPNPNWQGSSSSGSGSYTAEVTVGVYAGAGPGGASDLLVAGRVGLPLPSATAPTPFAYPDTAFAVAVGSDQFVTCNNVSLSCAVYSAPSGGGTITMTHNTSFANATTGMPFGPTLLNASTYVAVGAQHLFCVRDGHVVAQVQIPSAIAQVVVFPATTRNGTEYTAGAVVVTAQALHIATCESGIVSSWANADFVNRVAGPLYAPNAGTAVVATLYFLYVVDIATGQQHAHQLSIGLTVLGAAVIPPSTPGAAEVVALLESSNVMKGYSATALTQLWTYTNSSSQNDELAPITIVMAVDGQVFVQLEDVTSPGYQYALVAISAVTGVAAKERMVSSTTLSWLQPPSPRLRTMAVSFSSRPRCSS